jgi:hypothetical protein
MFHRFLLFAFVALATLDPEAGARAEDPAGSAVGTVDADSFVVQDSHLSPADFELDDLEEFKPTDIARSVDGWFSAPSANLRGGAPEPWTMDGYFPYVQRFGVAHDAGDGVGFGESFTTFEYFTPIRGDLVWDNLFADCRFIVRNNAFVGGNVGVGYRHYSLEQNRIWGLNVYGDWLQTDVTDYGQLGVGVETFGTLIDARANAYIPGVDQTRGQVPNQFQGNLLIINLDELAMTGGDAEIGLNLVDLDRAQARIFGGLYYFDAETAPHAFGWRARAEATVDQLYWLDVSVQDDQVFGTTWTIGFAIRALHRFLPPNAQAHKPMDHHYYRRSGDAAAGNIAHRLSAPVERLQNIVITRAPQIATDETGTPLNFLHVVDGAGGTGTFEDPYGTLTAALADPDAGMSIIYTPEGGDFVENITLVPGATILSNGPLQRIRTQFGLQTLPFSGTSPDLMDLPTLTGTVDMADDSRFSGFSVTGEITATGVSNVTIDRSTISSAAGDAVTLTGVDSAVLDTVGVASTAGVGLFVDDSSAVITELTVNNAASNGVEVLSAGTDRTVEFTDLVVTAAAAQGLRINVGGAGDLSVSLDGTSSIRSTGNALHALTSGGSTGDLTLAINGATFSSSAGAGMNINGTAGAGTIYVTSLDQNVISAAMTGGLLVDTATFDADPTTPAIDQVQGSSLTIGASGAMGAVTGDGVRLLDPTGDLRIETLTIFNRMGTGLLVDTKGGGTIFNLETGPASSITTTMGAALSLDPLTIDLQFATLQSTNSAANAIFLDTVAGTLTSASTTLNGSVAKSILIQNTPAPLLVNFGETTIDSTIGPTVSDNVDTSMGNGGNLTLEFESLLITFP